MKGKIVLYIITPLFILFIIPFVTANLEDNFDRTDSNTVGGGWGENGGNSADDNSIFDNALLLRSDTDVQVGQDASLSAESYVNNTGNFTVISTAGVNRKFFIGIKTYSAYTNLQGLYLVYDVQAGTLQLRQNGSFLNTTALTLTTGVVQHYEFVYDHPNLRAYTWTGAGSKPSTPTLNATVTGDAGTGGNVTLYNDNAGHQQVIHYDNYFLESTRLNQKGINITAIESVTLNSLSEYNVSLYNYTSGALIRYNYTTGTNNFIWINDSTGSTNLTIKFIKTGYDADNYTFLWDNATQTHQFTATPVPSINLTFYDEQTNELLLKNVTYSVLYGDGSAHNGSTDTGSTTNITVSTGVVEITYDSELYHERKYFVNLTPTNLSVLRLYLLNKTAENVAEISYRLTDENFRTISNGYLKVLRRYIEGGAEVTRVVEISKSDINGEGVVHLEKITADYQYVIEYLGNTVLITGINPLKDDTTNLVATVEEDVVDSLFLKTDITTNLTYNNNTRKFTFVYNDPNNIVEEICMRIDRILGTGSITVNESCLSTSTGTITLGIPSDEGEYIAYSYIDTNTAFSVHPLEQLGIKDTDQTTLMAFGIFGALLISLALALGGLIISKGNPIVTLTMFGVGAVIVSTFLGLAIFTYTSLAVLLFTIVLIISISRRRGE